MRLILSCQRGVAKCTNCDQNTTQMQTWTYGQVDKTRVDFPKIDFDQNIQNNHQRDTSVDSQATNEGYDIRSSIVLDCHVWRAFLGMAIV